MHACINLSLLQGMYIWVAKDAPQALIQKIFGVQHFGAIPEVMVSACTTLVAYMCRTRLSPSHDMLYCVSAKDCNDGEEPSMC